MPTSGRSTRSLGRSWSRPISSSRASSPIARSDATPRWGGSLGTAILDGGETLETLEAKVAAGTIDPRPTSGHQELLENVVNRSVWAADASPVKSGAGR